MGNLLGCVQVDQSTVAIRERFGKFDSVLEPGCHCLPWCLGSQVAGHLSLRLQQLDVRCETKTKVFFFSFLSLFLGVYKGKISPFNCLFDFCSFDRIMCCECGINPIPKSG